ncbi:NifU family protein [Streptomyces sp. NPDC005407]|uniref:NifU family protein n=1 Tax=Streptomyces sp. NPDC005407 TaxID=3155340 RepID=UPI0033A05C67
MPWDDEEARRHVLRLDELLAALDGLPDHAAAARANDAVQALVDLYGECLRRIMGQLADGAEAVRRLAADELVGHLLLVHDLHPDPVAARVEAAIAELRSVLRRKDGDIELLGLDGAVARVRLTEGSGSGGGCGCSAEPPDAAVRDAVMGRAPEIEQVEIETVRASKPQALIPVDSLFRSPVTAGRATG